MDPSLQPLLALLGRLPEEFRDIRTEVETAVRVMDQAPSLAVVPPRKVLDLVVREVYERCLREPAGTRPLEGLTQRLVKEGHLPPGLEGYASLIRQHGNVGAHHAGQALTAANARDSLLALLPILDWYVQRHAPGTPAPPSPVPAPAAARPETRAAVVPKGLRSFDAHDADFFLDLLPGPRDRGGLPESIRFWMHRIEQRDEPTFAVGVIYGPSGCGKSSLVKAGLLPRLAGNVARVYVEATAADTEARLLRGLRKHCPDLPGDLDLTRTMAALRRGEGPGMGRKVFLVLDQFEQWLHARRGEGDTELAEALRQCDGEHVQCVVLVRDDFWMGLTRFMQQLHIELVQGQNIAAVDLFDPMHARNVLFAFGRAFGRLPAEPSKEQESFLNQAVAGLSQDGRVISVRLALFAEMAKGKPWTPATLKEVGGAEGVGVAFLEETFGARTANLRHRAHEQAARAVLRALLPEQGGDIKGNMQSHGNLLVVSGYARRPQDFEELLRILDSEVRLITPTEPAGSSSEGQPGAAAPGERYYQLTHDYLVHSLREWLTRKQKETRRGRAELRLAERAAAWAARPETRQLPAWWEWLNIRLFTRKRNWKADQRRMMRKAARYHLVRGAILAVAVAALTVLGLTTRARVEERNNETHAADLVHGLRGAQIDQVPAIIDELKDYRRWADRPLREENERAAADSREKLNTALALLPLDDSQEEYVKGRLLTAAPNEVSVLVAALGPRRDGLREWLWNAAEQQPPPGKEGQRLRAASGLAAFDADDLRWDRLAGPVAADLVSVPAVYLADWIKALAPVRDRLLPSLSALCRDPGRGESERYLATDVLRDYAADRPEVLADVLMSADERQWVRLWPKVPPQRDGAIARFTQELDKTLAPDWKDAPLDASWGAPQPALVRQVEAAAGMVGERFAMCQTLPLADFDALTAGLRKAGYRPLRFRPYSRKPDAQARDIPDKPDAQAKVSVLVAALWTRDGREAPYGYGLTPDEATKRDAEMRERGLVPLDVAGYPSGNGAAESRYAVLWGPKETGTEDVKMYVGVTALRHQAAWEPLQKSGFVPLTQSQFTIEGTSRRSAVWWKPARTLETKSYNFSWSEEQYEQALTPSNLQLDLRLAWDPSGVVRPRRLGAASLGVAPAAGLGGVPWAALALGNAAAEAGPPGVEFAATWIDSATHVSAEVHGLDPAAHLARCRELAAQGYRPASLTVVEDGGGRLLTGSVWHRPVVPEGDRDALAKRQAQAATALLQLGAPERVWPLLEHRPDPRLRSFLIHRLALTTDPATLLQRLGEEREVSRRRALVLTLGAYPAGRLDPALRKTWQDRLRKWYHDEPDAGVHSAVEWLLRSWEDGPEVAKMEKAMIRVNPEGQSEGGRRWYVNGQGQTMVIVRNPGEFWMGSPGSEADRDSDETLHRVRIPRSFSIATKEVTVEQMLRFQPKFDYARAVSPRPDMPVNDVTWYEAANYCNWLSKQEGIPESEWCYLRNDAGEYDPGMRLAPAALEKMGYRLPTEAEWEYACRAGAVTRRYYGDTDELLGEYDRQRTSSKKDEVMRVGGLLKPNDLGLFDLYGNAMEWVLDSYQSYRWTGHATARVDNVNKEDAKVIDDSLDRCLRGVSYYQFAPEMRSANRRGEWPGSNRASYGFRVARTCH
jgi:formylglycine-generating enzyme required for sulfatase activity